MKKCVLADLGQLENVYLLVGLKEPAVNENDSNIAPNPLSIYLMCHPGPAHFRKITTSSYSMITLRHQKIQTASVYSILLPQPVTAQRMAAS